MPPSCPWPIAVALRAYPRRFLSRFGDDLALSLTDDWQQVASQPRRLRWRHRLGLLTATATSGLAERGAVVSRQTWRTSRPHLYTPSGRRATMWDALMHDVRAAVRSLAHARAFAALAVLALALGIGANGAIFTVVNGVLLKPLPYRDADRLVMLWSRNPQMGGAANVVSPGDYEDLRAMSRSFEAVEYALSFMVRLGIIGRESDGLLNTARVSDGALQLLGVTPQAGRIFGKGERGVAVLSDAAWRGRFGADPGIVGRSLTMSGNETLQIVGIAPPGFVFPYRSMLGPGAPIANQTADLWVPMPMEGPRFVAASGQFVRPVHFLIAVARLAPAVTIAQADAEVAIHAATLATRYPATNTGWGATVVGLHEQTVGEVRPALLVLLGGVAVLLLMATVNVANLMLARGLERQRELAVRAAMGASRWQMVRQALIEGLVLAGVGATGALLVLRWAVQGLVALAPSTLPRIGEVGADATMVGVAAVLAVVVGVAVSLVPMWAASRTDLRASLQDASRGATGASTAGRRMRTALVAGQVALAAALAVQAGLLARSFDQLLRVDPGFQPDHLLTLQMNVPDRHTTPDARRAFYEDWFARVQSLPGVVAVGGTTRIPLGSTNVSTTVTVQGRVVDKARLPEVEFRRAMHDYFSAMRIPIRQGRGFAAEDGPTAPQVVVVNETLAAQIFPGETPIGQRVALGPSGDGPWLTIVGVIGDVRHGSLEAPPAPELYISYRQNPPVSPFMAVRTSGDPAALAGQLRQVSRSLDPSLLLFDVRTMDDLRSASVGERRFTLTLVLAFGLVALTLAAVGVYGTMALMVTERRPELGLRVALGAMPGTVVRLVVGSALKVTVVGLMVGLAVGAAVARLLESQLFGIKAFDPVTFVSVPMALALAAALAALAPARRAVRVDPLSALRND